MQPFRQTYILSDIHNKLCQLGNIKLLQKLDIFFTEKTLKDTYQIAFLHSHAPSGAYPLGRISQQRFAEISSTLAQKFKSKNKAKEHTEGIK